MINSKMLYKGIAFVAVIFLITFVSKLPASLIQKPLSQAQGIKVSTLKGTIWNGYAEQFNIAAKGGHINIGKLSWQLKAHCLIFLKACAKIQLVPNAQSNGEIYVDANIEAGMDKSISIQALQSNMDAGWLMEMAGAPISATGKIDFTSDKVLLTPENKLPMIEGILRWNQAAIDYPEEYALGNYIVTLNTQDDNDNRTITGVLSDENGLISSSGNIDVNQQEQVNININLSPNDRTPESLSSILSLIGKPNRQGAYTIRQRTTLSRIL